MSAQEVADFAAAELADERKTLSEFRQRALTIVTTSGTLVTFLSGLVAIAVTTKNKDVFPKSAHRPLVLALSFFVAAAIAALVANWPRDTRLSNGENLKQRVTDDCLWNESASDSLRAIADCCVDQLQALRGINKQVAWALIVSISFEILAAAATGLTAFRIVMARS